MADRHPAILIGTVLLVFALTYVITSQITHAWRGAAAGVLLAGAGGALIRFAKTRRHAMARALFAVAATLIAAPGAGLMAAQNDFLFGMIDGLDGSAGFDDALFDRYEFAMALGLQMLGVGALIALILAIVGWRLHRSP